jgi:hypothetical protein
MVRSGGMNREGSDKQRSTRNRSCIEERGLEKNPEVRRATHVDLFCLFSPDPVYAVRVCVWQVMRPRDLRDMCVRIIPLNAHFCFFSLSRLSSYTIIGSFLENYLCFMRSKLRTTLSGFSFFFGEY